MIALKERINLGFDLDGVICHDLHIPKILSRYTLVWRLFRSLQRPIFIPPERAIIVTGRPEWDIGYTLRWLRRNGIKNRVEFNSGYPTLEDSVKTKSNAIHLFGIGRFYESDEQQVKMIRERVPQEVSVILWRNFQG